MRVEPSANSTSKRFDAASYLTSLAGNGAALEEADPVGGMTCSAAPFGQLA